MSSDEAVRGGPDTGAFATLTSRPDGHPPTRLFAYVLRCSSISRLLFAKDDEAAHQETSIAVRRLLAGRPFLGRTNVSLTRASEADVAAYSAAWRAIQS